MDSNYLPLFDPEDSEETPQESGVPIIHIVPESGKASRWNHIEDLDYFFTQIYNYHQNNGFCCMVTSELLQLFKFFFIVFLCVFLINCVDLSIITKERFSNQTQKVSIFDAVLPYDQCISNMGFWTWCIIVISSITWIYYLVKFATHIFQYVDVRAFFNTALKISDNNLSNVTWYEVQNKIREVQQEQQMCIHKKDLSQLDIYHRILRFKNYMAAMVNKSLLPVRLNVPFIGEKIYMSHSLKLNYELLLFRGPWSPFKDSWHLKEEYKKVHRRQELAYNLQKLILFTAIINLVLSPLIFLWQIAHTFFNYTELLKREPGALGIRCWSVYSRIYLRHFNELDHELRARLNRAYEPASKYVAGFTSPLMVVIAKQVQFVSGAITGVLIVMSVIDEDVLHADHVLILVSAFGMVFACSRSMVPDENMVWRPESLMTQILGQVQYLPSTWKGLAHTSKVKEEFSHLFPYRATLVFEELISPFVTPFILMFHLRPKALDIVDFFRNFTVEVIGVGDVCSFAQMDVRRHGNPSWQSPSSPNSEHQANQYTQAEDGKTELSLMHFTHTNPDWQLPQEAQNFMSAVRSQAQQDQSNYVGQNPDIPDKFQMNTGIPGSSLASLGAELSCLFPRYTTPVNIQNEMSVIMSPYIVNNPVMSGVNKFERPISTERSFRYVHPHHQAAAMVPSLGASVFGPGVDMDIDITASDMSTSALYLHELHHRRIKSRGHHVSADTVPIWQRTGTISSGGERTPLLNMPSHPS